MASLSRQDITDILTCQQCLNSVMEPRLLPCHHSFCLPCLDQMAASTQDIQAVVCAVCKECIPTPLDGVVDFPENTFLRTLSEADTSCTTSPRSNTNSEIREVKILITDASKAQEGYKSVMRTLDKTNRSLEEDFDDLRHRVDAVAEKLHAQVDSCKETMLERLNQAESTSKVKLGECKQQLTAVSDAVEELKRYESALAKYGTVSDITSQLSSLKRKTVKLSGFRPDMKWDYTTLFEQDISLGEMLGRPCLDVTYPHEEQKQHLRREWQQLLQQQEDERETMRQQQQAEMDAEQTEMREDRQHLEQSLEKLKVKMVDMRPSGLIYRMSIAEEETLNVDIKKIKIKAEEAKEVMEERHTEERKQETYVYQQQRDDLYVQHREQQLTSTVVNCVLTLIITDV